MSDIENVLNTVQEHGTTAGLAVVGAYVAKKVLGGSLDAVGVALRDLTERRLENLRMITAKADALNNDEESLPHVRVTQKVLTDATLYDDDVQHSYVAGLVAGSRNEDGSDDRPIYYLTVIDGLTAAQLRLFHVLYVAGSQVAHETPVAVGAIPPRVEIDGDEAMRHLQQLNADSSPDAVLLMALEHAGLIDELEVEVDDNQRSRIRFRPTRIGMLLYDWAHGFDDEDVQKFSTRDRPDIGLPPYVFTTARSV